MSLRKVVVLAACAPLALCACCLPSRAGRPAEAANLAVTVEGMGTQPQGGLPDRVRIVVRNASVESLLFPRPRAMIDEQTVTHAKGPLVALCLLLRDKEGHEEVPVYTHPEAKAPAEPTMVRLPPGGTWSGEYSLREFYFWGPCGPDTGGAFTQYFRKGDEEVALTAALLWLPGGEDTARAESNSIGLHLWHKEWLFKKQAEPL